MHIAITAEDPFVTAELFKKGFGLNELSRGDSDLAREVYLTDGYINIAIVCWKRTKETPNPYPDGYGLDHFGFQVEDFESAEKRATAGGGHAATAATGRPLQARRAHLLRNQAAARGRQVRPLRPRLAHQGRMIALEAEGVRKLYTKNGQSLAVVDVARFAAQDGEFITVIGPSGCGKSTFLHIAGGFIPPDSGSIRVYGKDARPRPRPRHDVSGIRAFPWKTVAGNVAWGLEAQGWEKTHRRNGTRISTSWASPISPTTIRPSSPAA